MDQHANFGYGTVATPPSPADSGTSLVLTTGQGARFPNPADGNYNLTIWPTGSIPLASNAEIVRATALSTDTFTITRQQESTSARAIIAGDQVMMGITKKVVDDIETLAKSQIQGALINGRISVTVASNNITVAIKTMAGSDATVSTPIYIRIGNNIRTLTAALSITLNAGSNWFNAGSAETATKEIDYFTYLIWKASDSSIVLAFSRIPYARLYSDFSATTTNDKYVSVSATPAATDEVENIGRFNATLSAGAGYTWSIPATQIIINKPIFETRWLNFVPAYSASGAMTYTSVTTNYGKYRISRNVYQQNVYATGTTGGVASNQLFATTAMAAASGPLSLGAGVVTDGGGGLVGQVIQNSTTSIYMTKTDNSVFGLGADRIMSFVTVQELG